jgi:hypothetical protein
MISDAKVLREETKLITFFDSCIVSDCEMFTLA